MLIAATVRQLKMSHLPWESNGIHQSLPINQANPKKIVLSSKDQAKRSEKETQSKLRVIDLLDDSDLIE